MQKKDILPIAVGEAGGKFVNEILLLDKRYTGLYVNGNYDDFASLETANENNIFIITGSLGTGKNRSKSKLMLKDNINSIMDEILKYKTAKILHFFFSLGGGTGGGSVPTIIKALGKLQKSGKINVAINITCVLPAYNESKRYRKNAIECWNEIAELDNINSIYLLDNNTRDNEEDINKEFARQFNMFMDMAKNSPSKELKSRIDSEEVENLAVSVGSTTFYELPSSHNDLQEAMETALNNSIFAVTEGNISKCEYVGIVTQEGVYTQKEIENIFDPDEYTVGAYNNDYNFIVVTGRPPQKEAIETLKESVEEEENNKTKNNVLSNLKIDTTLNTKQPKSVEIKTQQYVKANTNKTVQENQSIDDILNDDELWDDIF